ncbi:hypothetical protein AciPR4_0099 [Terriglobus saanensis SP1PR4]|uniref:Uncharacterized protein n=1 Tax=Terriglobus saanensis (strain ATCC BAA-1853 / DSM 23119 / SP1PR4) TaxID=401053 RepID=E8UYZ5_TERSS|nr:hypothetical protein AciPR4_0099 [Terriglobus saanensis SP1PR4]
MVGLFSEGSLFERTMRFAHPIHRKERDVWGTRIWVSWGSGLCALRDSPFSTPTNKKPFVGDPGFAMKLRKNGAQSGSLCFATG